MVPEGKGFGAVRRAWPVDHGKARRVRTAFPARVGKALRR